MMKALAQIAVLIVVIALVAVCCVRYAAGRCNWLDGKTETVMHSSSLMHELEKIADLCTLRVPLTDVLDGSRKGMIRNVRGIWIVKGDALIGVDMTQAKVETNNAGHATIVRLPMPSVKYARVDHERTKTYNIERGILTSSSWESHLRDEAMRQAQRMIETMAATTGHIHAAQAHTERIVKTFCAGAGVAVDIVWDNSSEDKERQ